MRFWEHMSFGNTCRENMTVLRKLSRFRTSTLRNPPSILNTTEASWSSILEAARRLTQTHGSASLRI